MKQRWWFWGVPLCAGALIAAFLLVFSSRLSATAHAQSLEAVRQNVSRCMVQCYAVEGRYPPSISYLESHYGLTVDHDRYLIHYEVFGANLMPHLIVAEK